MTVEELKKALPKGYYVKISDTIYWSNENPIPAFDVKKYGNKHFVIKVDNESVGLINTCVDYPQLGSNLPYQVMKPVLKFANTLPKERFSKDPRKTFRIYLEHICKNYVRDNKVADDHFKCDITLRDYHEDPYDYVIVILNGDQFKVDLRNGLYKHSSLNEHISLPSYIDSRISDYCGR